MKSPLSPWMRPLLFAAAGYNLLAGASMLVFVHEGYKLLGLSKPELVLPVQLLGIIVAIFGVGYWIAAREPVENRNVLLLGLLSKTLGPLAAMYYIAAGKLPLAFLLVLVVSDLAWVPPMAIIFARARRIKVPVN